MLALTKKSKEASCRRDRPNEEASKFPGQKAAESLCKELMNTWGTKLVQKRKGRGANKRVVGYTYEIEHVISANGVKFRYGGFFFEVFEFFKWFIEFQLMLC